MPLFGGEGYGCHGEVRLLRTSLLGDGSYEETTTNAGFQVLSGCHRTYNIGCKGHDFGCHGENRIRWKGPKLRGLGCHGYL